MGLSRIKHIPEGQMAIEWASQVPPPLADSHLWDLGHQRHNHGHQQRQDLESGQS